MENLSGYFYKKEPVKVTMTVVDRVYSNGHTQGTDQGLDTGGSNAVTAAEVKSIVHTGIKSLASGDWKRVTSIEYNPSTGQLRVNYDDGL